MEILGAQTQILISGESETVHSKHQVRLCCPRLHHLTHVSGSNSASSPFWRAKIKARLKGLTRRGTQEFVSVDSLLMLAMECEPILNIYELLQQSKLWSQIGPRPRLVFSLPGYLCFPDMFFLLLFFLFSCPLQYLNLRNEGGQRQSMMNAALWEMFKVKKKEREVYQKLINH